MSAGPLKHLSYENLPMGEAVRPLVLRTYIPNLHLGSEVLKNHGEGRKTPRYSPATGLLSPVYDKPVLGLPAAIAVNSGPSFSYVWDTTECRLLYVWRGGFLDMEPYWGTPEEGLRKKNDYVPRLVGELFYKANGEHPLRVAGRALESVQYAGFRRTPTNGVVFDFVANGERVEAEILPGAEPMSFEVRYRSSAQLDYEIAPELGKIVSYEEGIMKVSFTANTRQMFEGYTPEKVEIVAANAEDGERLYQNMGCFACHSRDGSKAHGPSFLGLADSERFFADQSKSLADTDYLKQSIQDPNAKVVEGFAQGLMPAYSLKDKEVESLVLFIQSLK
ncbi:c-type cytochrome [Roseibacillus persicicus]|uniref:c-type cytochrome n=1 Tax=Roseibacillus persicicus TaxID=454148 RepID=UPI00280FC717|nr:cytochrome c [Roseibacillus persicicus]MDQ8188921.1 cytochrome c [Roseibacillus persicicus]